MHYTIDLRGPKKEVVEKLKADKGPADAGLKVLFDMVMADVAKLLSPQPDTRPVEVIAYIALGDPAGSLSYSIKVEG